jgi:hypothetical protein
MLQLRSVTTMLLRIVEYRLGEADAVEGAVTLGRALADQI